MTDEPETQTRLRIVIVDDHALFRDGLATILDAQPDMQVVGQGGTADEAVDMVRQLLPDLILLDLDMPGGGIEAARTIASGHPATRIVVLTASEDEDDLVAVLKSGARAYILKGVTAREVLRILRAVAAGESYVPAALAASLLMERHGPGDSGSSVPARHKPGNQMDELTERERQILDGLASGYSNKEIGQKLFLSDKTVKHYITNILQKLQVRNRVEAALLAQRSQRPK